MGIVPQYQVPNFQNLSLLLHEDSKKDPQKRLIKRCTTDFPWGTQTVYVPFGFNLAQRRVIDISNLWLLTIAQKPVLLLID